MSDYISAELAATCAALGYYDGHKYHLDKHCLDVIKDLIKYLKRDDDSHTIRCFLGQAKLLQTDLLKIFVQYAHKREIWDVLLRLIINLTSPTFTIYNEQIPTEKTARAVYQQIITHLQGYKVALTDNQIWLAVKNRLSEILNIESSERGEENEMTIDRVLVFIRNVLQIPPDENEKRLDNDASLHDQILFALHMSGIVDLLLFIASNSAEQQYHMQMLEIMSLMLREQNAATLATSGLQRSTIEKEKDEAALLAVRQKELQEKQDKIKKYAGSRHSRFGGTFVVQNMKAIGENQLLCHKPYQTIEGLKFGHNKKKFAKPKNKRPMQDSKEERTSALCVRLFLKEFCMEFLNGAYNPIMRYARSCVISGSDSDAYESTCYLWALRFFMEFNRHYKFQVKYVSETISTEIFHLVQRQMEHFYEMIVMDKKKIPLWSRRLHLALKAYQELLHTLMAMDNSADRGVRESSKVIKSNVFYVPEYRETILSQLLCYDEVKMSRLYLIDLVTTAHIFLKMLGHFCGRGNRSLIVQKVKHKRQKDRSKKKPVQGERAPIPSLDERWDDIAPQLSAVMQEGRIPEVVPFDATLDIPIDDQKSDAMKKIQKLLRTKYLEQAVGLIRAARDVWPENDCFGTADISAEEEFLALREIFFADLGVVDDDPVAAAGHGENIENSFNYASGSNEEENEDEEGGAVYEETKFNFSEFLQRFANVKLVKAMQILLEQFDKNTKEVNHYVAKMLHRIAWDCKMPGMMFQASIFRAFQRILDSKHPDHKELQKFAIFIIRRFAEVAQKNQKAYMELLFWKTTRDATAVVDGYTAETGSKKAARGVWTEAEEDELRTLFMEHQNNKYAEDVVDWILEHLINQDRTRRGVHKKLKEMYLITDSKPVRSDEQKRPPKEWAEDEVAQLTELWEQFKDSDDPVDSIFAELRVKRPKPKIKEQLLELGLAKDRKELHKKRSRKSNHGKSSWETQSAGNSGEDEGTDGEGTGKSSRRNSVASSKPTNRGGRKGARKQPTIVYTDAQLSGLLKDVINKHMRDSLEWIKESLQDALDDRDEEETEGVPLVPLTDYSSAAMDTPSFQKLLRALGITPPADEQESYWRIPANILSSTIQKRCNLIENALAGKFIVEEQVETQKKVIDVDEINSDSDDDVDVLENVRKFFATKEPVPSTSYQSESETTAITDVKRSRKASNNPKSKKNTPNPENIEETDSNISQSVEETQGKIKKPGGRAILVIDSSDSEMEIETKHGDDGKRERSDSSDKENTTVKKRRLLDSEEEDDSLKIQEVESKPTRGTISEDEEGVSQEVQRNARKSSRVLISDDEE